MERAVGVRAMAEAIEQGDALTELNLGRREPVTAARRARIFVHGTEPRGGIVLPMAYARRRSGSPTRARCLPLGALSLPGAPGFTCTVVDAGYNGQGQGSLDELVLYDFADGLYIL